MSSINFRIDTHIFKLRATPAAHFFRCIILWISMAPPIERCQNEHQQQNRVEYTACISDFYPTGVLSLEELPTVTCWNPTDVSQLRTAR